MDGCPAWLPDDVVTVTLDSPASGGVEAEPLLEDMRLDAERVRVVGSDVGAGPGGGEGPAPRIEAAEYIEVPERRRDCISDRDDLAVNAGSGNGV
jgi:hypothetical protein